MTGSIRLGALGAFALMVACGEPDVILPGERFDIRDTGSAVNQALPISLPAQRLNASWTHRNGDADHKITHPALSANPSLIFTANIGEGDSRRARITADPVVAGGVIYTLDARAQVTATGLNGATLWTANVTPGTDGASDASGGGISISGGVVYVATGFGRITALSATNGGEIWTQDLDAPGRAAPTVSGDLVYVVSRDGTAWALETSNGRIRWQLTGTPALGNFSGGAAPAVSDGLVVFPFPSGEVLAAFPEGGLRRWSTVISGARPGSAAGVLSDIAGDPVIANGKVYVGNFAGQIVALEQSNGDRLWTANEGAISPVWPVGGSVFALNDINELVRIADSDGTVVWRTDLPDLTPDGTFFQSNTKVAHYGPVLAGGRLIVASSDGLIRQFDPVSGAVVGTIALPGGAASHPVVAGGVLYVVSKDGQLHAYR